MLKNSVAIGVSFLLGSFFGALASFDQNSEDANWERNPTAKLFPPRQPLETRSAREATVRVGSVIRKPNEANIENIEGLPKFVSEHTAQYRDPDRISPDDISKPTSYGYYRDPDNRELGINLPLRDLQQVGSPKNPNLWPEDFNLEVRNIKHGPPLQALEELR